MRLAVVAYPPYKGLLALDGTGAFDLDLPDGSTLREVLRMLAKRSREFQPWADARRDEWLWGQLLVHVRGEMVRLDDVLHDGDRLELLPPIAGGAC
ncbi:MAG TPA: MoaD/ThiS family protein [Chloroflexota bacterium]|jgi:molybdopterin converting factor small subunit|nr:MoaD/ThiS family protein [Chloroflexota bacterium]